MKPLLILTIVLGLATVANAFVMFTLNDIPFPPGLTFPVTIQEGDTVTVGLYDDTTENTHKDVIIDFETYANLGVTYTLSPANGNQYGALTANDIGGHLDCYQHGTAEEIDIVIFDNPSPGQMYNVILTGLKSNVVTINLTDQELPWFNSTVIVTITPATHAATWRWASGSNATNQNGFYGTKGAASPENVPGARQYSVSWKDGRGNLWLFGGNGYDKNGNADDLSDLWKFDGTCWTWVSGPSIIDQYGYYVTKGLANSLNVPGARESSVSWIDRRGNLWLFGGYGLAETSSFNLLNDLWKFDGTNWTFVSGSNTVNQSGVYGTKGVPDSLNVPGSRRDSVSWIDGYGNLWLFGGQGYDAYGNGTYLNDLWKFDDANWTWVSGSKAANQWGVYGTEGKADSLNVPGARCQSVSWIDGYGNLWLFGGWGLDASGNWGELNDLWKFDGTNWTWVSGTSALYQHGVYGTKGVAASGNMPGARATSISWIDGRGNLCLFGGYGFVETGSYDCLNDLWKFNPLTSLWTWVGGSKIQNQHGIYGTEGQAASGNVPGARGGGVSWIDGYGNLWLFGGHGYAESGNWDELNDLWKFVATDLDLNNDGIINFQDLSIMAAHWLE